MACRSIPATGLLVWTPATLFAGQLSFEVKVTDGRGGGRDTERYTLTIVERLRARSQARCLWI